MQDSRDALAHLVEEGVDEGLRLEECQVVGLLAYADVFDGQAYRLSDRDHNAAFRGTIQFRQDDAGALHGLGEMLGLADPVLARRGIQEQDHLVGRFGDLFPDDAMDLGQFLHEVLLSLQAAGGVDNAHVGVDFKGLCDSTMGDTRGIGALFPGNDLGPQPSGPDRKLFHSGRRERYRRLRARPFCPTPRRVW